MNSPALNIESLEPRTLLASLVDAEGENTASMASDSEAFQIEDALVTHDHETNNDKKHSKHSFKERLSSAAHTMKDGFEHTAHKAFHILKEGIKITGEGMCAVGDASPGATEGRAIADLVSELAEFV